MKKSPKQSSKPITIRVVPGTDTDEGNLRASARRVGREGDMLVYEVHGEDREELAASMRSESSIIASASRLTRASEGSATGPSSHSVVGERAVAEMLDDLNSYHESRVGGVRMQVTMEPSPGKYKMYRLFVDGKLVSTAKFSPGTGEKTHPFGLPGGAAEAFFRKALGPRAH